MVDAVPERFNIDLQRACFGSKPVRFRPSKCFQVCASKQTRGVYEYTIARLRRAAASFVYRADYRCSHSIAIGGNQWPDNVWLSDLEPKFVCKACGRRGTDVRPDFNWSKQPVEMMGYR
jgi:hypothetical protein